MNKQHIIYHEDLATINSLWKYVKSLPQGDPEFNCVHGMLIKEAEIKWDYLFPAISGKCNVCDYQVTGFDITSNICKNVACSNGNLQLKLMKSKWFWARFYCKDKNGDNGEHLCMANHEFTKAALDICTHGDVKSVKDFELIINHNGAFNKMVKDLVPAVMDVLVLLRRRTPRNNENDNDNNILISIELPSGN